MGAFFFTAPLALAGLLALPLIYFLLRVTPPRPRQVVFPPMRLLLELSRQEATPARTPWPLLALRLAIAAAAVFAMAGPVWRPSALERSSNAPLAIAIDDGWPAAPSWERRAQAAQTMIDSAARAGAPVALLAMSDGALDVSAEDGATAQQRLRSLRPKPFIPDRRAAAARLAKFAQAHPAARIVWIADGLEAGEAAVLGAAMKDAAHNGAEVEVVTDAHVPLALASPANTASGSEVEVLRAAVHEPARGRVLALDAQGRTIAQAPFDFGAELTTQARFDLPVELRNDIVMLQIMGEFSAGAVALFDGRSRVRRIGVVSGAGADQEQPLLSPAYYLDKALAPFAQVRQARAGVADPTAALLEEHPDVLALADVGLPPGETHDALARFVEEGGALLRFSGPHLANAADDLIPVRLRRSDRVLGGAMSWQTPKKLAPFEPHSPFFGLAVPDDVSVARQVLAEPELGIEAKTWARLADGTPLVTAERRGKGLVALFHVSADTAWSNLPISGLFVDMLRKISALGGEAGARRASGAATQDQASAPQTLAPLRTLDGFGVFGAPPPTAKPIAADFSGRANVDHPPGFYGAADAPVAVQTLAAGDVLQAMDYSTLGLRRQNLGVDASVDLRPALLAIVFVALLIDWLVLLLLTGKLRQPARAVGALCVLALVGAMAPRVAHAEPPKSVASPRDRDAALATRLAYVVSGDAHVDEASRLGLATLSRVLAQRTSFAPGEPASVDPARDELAFYPMLYWPIAATAPQPSALAVAKIGTYMKQGGVVVFDTRDALTARRGGPPTPETLWLRDLTRRLDIPELEIVPRDHVITKTFYLLDGFYGRTTNGETWVEALPPEPEGDAPRPVRAADSVSSIVIASNDLAAAWAVDASGEPLYPLIPGGARQRELALRGGVNLVMYTLTGNYKADQVHARDLLERLGQ